MPVEVGAESNTFALSELFGVLDVPGPDLLLRAYGEQALPVLERHLLDVPEGRALVLSFAGVRIMTPSFADATIVALLRGLREGRYGERYLLLAEPNEETLVGLAGTFERRLHRSLKLAIVLRCGGTHRLFGPVEENLQAAWQLVAERGTLTTRELADELGLEINTASMRLLKLHGLGLLARREEVSAAGRQHIYTLPT
jgi:predicted transcriptional regulator